MSAALTIGQALLPTACIVASAGAIILACIWVKIARDARIDAAEHDGAERDAGLPGRATDDPFFAAYIHGFQQGVLSERRRHFSTAQDDQEAVDAWSIYNSNKSGH
jgi:hypothetical protein